MLKRGVLGWGCGFESISSIVQCMAEGNEDVFKEDFKHFKRKSTDLRDVLDTRNERVCSVCHLLLLILDHAV